MRYIEKSLFFKDRYCAEIKTIQELKEQCKMTPENILSSSTHLITGIKKTIEDKKEKLFLHFLMFKIAEELLYKDKVIPESIHFQESLILKMNIWDDRIIFTDMMKIKGMFASYSDFSFKRATLLPDLISFAEKIFPHSQMRNTFIEKIKDDYTFLEKKKIECVINMKESYKSEKNNKRI